MLTNYFIFNGFQNVLGNVEHVLWHHIASLSHNEVNQNTNISTQCIKKHRLQNIDHFVEASLCKVNPQPAWVWCIYAAWCNMSRQHMEYEHIMETGRVTNCGLHNKIMRKVSMLQLWLHIVQNYWLMLCSHSYWEKRFFLLRKCFIDFFHNTNFHTDLAPKSGRWFVWYEYIWYVNKYLLHCIY